jgi:serine/threonine protein kinase/tetratricopeptide (TPR) repeat protein
MVGQRVGRYRVLQRIGKGGMGEVYLAEDTSLGRKVALKFLSASLLEDDLARKRFLREAKSAASLDHPFICNVHEVDQTENKQDFIVMEFVPGNSLSQLLTEGPLPLLDGIKIMVEVCEALQVAHSEGIVHRDLKPSNIMITTGGHSKVMDFGLAKRMEPSEDPDITSVLTEKGKVLGTPAYMSPEQLQGEELDVRADIFSLGVIGIQMLTGVHPFHKASTAATVSGILHDPPLGLTSHSLPEELRQILQKMLEKNPKKRYADCGELIGDLQEAISILSYPTTPIYPFQKRWWRANWRKVVLVGGTAALLAVILFHKPIADFFQLAPLPKNLTVVLLPFSGESPNDDTGAFAAGLHESLSKKLSRLSLSHRFNLVPSGLVRTREVNEPDQIERKLGGNLALLGDFRVADGVVHIDLQLVTGNSGRRLRYRSVSGTLEEPAALESSLVEAVVEMLGAEIIPKDRQIVHTTGFQNPRAYQLYLRGLGYQKIQDGDLDSAIEAFEKTQYLETRSALAQAGLGLTLFEKYRRDRQQGLLEKAMSHCQAARDINENSYEAHICVGEVSLAQDRVEDALEAFETVHALEPINDTALIRLELIYTQLGRRDTLEKLFQTATNRQPDFWRPHSFLGVFYFDDSRFEEAIVALNRVIELAPEYGSAYNALGASYASLFCWEQAIPMLRKARKAEKGEIVYTNVATAFFYSGRFVEAIAEAESAILYLEEEGASDGDHMDYGNLADIHYWSPGGDSRRADQCYRKAIELAERDLTEQPGHLETLGYLALYNAMISQREKAMDYLSQSLQPDPNNTRNLYRAALVYRVLDDQRQSLEHLELYLESGGNPKRPERDPAFDEIRSLPEYQEMASQFPSPGGCPESTLSTI